MKAYVLIDCPPDKAYRIKGEISRSDGVLQADVIKEGPHNLVAVIERDNAESMANMVVFQIRKLQGVKDVTVYLVSNGQDEEI